MSIGKMSTGKKKSKKLPDILSKEQIEKYLSALNTDTITGLRTRIAIELMYRAGLRVSEVVALRWFNIDYPLMVMLIQDSKGGKDRRVPIDKRLKKWLVKWENMLDEKGLKSSYIICTIANGKEKKQVCERQICRACHLLSEKSGVWLHNKNGTQRPVHPHVFRHCAATEWCREGITIAKISLLLGHADIATTMVYVNLSLADVQEEIQNRE